MDRELVGYMCGDCADVQRAHYEPTACFVCGARFDREARLALVWCTFRVEGLGVGFDVEPEYRGDWPDSARRKAAERLRVLHPLDG